MYIKRLLTPFVAKVSARFYAKDARCLLNMSRSCCTASNCKFRLYIEAILAWTFPQIRETTFIELEQVCFVHHIKLIKVLPCMHIKRYKEKTNAKKKPHTWNWFDSTLLSVFFPGCRRVAGSHWSKREARTTGMSAWVCMSVKGDGSCVIFLFYFFFSESVLIWRFACFLQACPRMPSTSYSVFFFLFYSFYR